MYRVICVMSIPSRICADWTATVTQIHGTKNIKINGNSGIPLKQHAQLAFKNIAQCIARSEYDNFMKVVCWLDGNLYVDSWHVDSRHQKHENNRMEIAE